MEQDDRDRLNRAVALQVAREALVGKGSAFNTIRGPGPDAMDLVNVARWVNTGEDPWRIEGEAPTDDENGAGDERHGDGVQGREG